jgi:hypothetical protein
MTLPDNSLREYCKMHKTFDDIDNGYRTVTVTIPTICDSVLWQLKPVKMRLVLENFKSLVLASSF